MVGWLSFLGTVATLLCGFWLLAYLSCLATRIAFQRLASQRFLPWLAGLLLGLISFLTWSLIPQPYSPFSAMPGFLVGMLLAMAVENSAHGPKYDWPWQLYGTIANAI